MPVTQTTSGRGYPLPYPSNLLAEDVDRLRNALQAIDDDITARPTSATVQGLVNAAVAALVNSSPAALDTLDELAAALGDDANFAATVATLLALKANIANVYSKTDSDLRYVQGPQAPADDSVTTQKLRDGAVTSAKLGANLTLSGTTTVGAIVEQATISAAAPTATQQYALSGKAVVYHTANATTNFTANFTGLSALAIGDSATFAVLVTNGETPYYITTIQVDGTTSGVATRWQGGFAPTSGNAGLIDSYSITIIKTGASSYTVMAAQTRF
jgi:hypothetical protein